jgi:CheY-like chemotaxis protein
MVKKPITILMADDDPDDCLLVKEAFEESRLLNEVLFVHDGENLMDYLYRRGKYSDPADSPRPGLILLDLNMPRKDGRQALEEIKADPDLRTIPVLVLSTSKDQEDILRSYDQGACSFVTKPASFEGLVEFVRSLKEYWLELVTLPTESEKD